MRVVSIWRIIAMNFPKQLVTIRKEQSFTQQGLADAVGLHVNQIKKYEAGAAQPTLKAIVNLAKALHVSLDELVFDESERGPDESLKLQFEAVSQMPDEDKRIIKALLEGMIIKYQTQKMVSGLSK